VSTRRTVDPVCSASFATTRPHCHLSSPLLSRERGSD
jgi:hypothetical protein